MKLLALFSTIAALVLGCLLIIEHMSTSQLSDVVRQRDLTIVTLRSINDGLVSQSQISTDSLLSRLENIEELRPGGLTSNVISTTHPNPEQMTWDYFGIELISDSSRRLIAVVPFKP